MPAPLAPMMPTTSPWSISNDTSRSAHSRSRRWSRASAGGQRPDPPGGRRQRLAQRLVAGWATQHVLLSEALGVDRDRHQTTSANVPSTCRKYAAPVTRRSTATALDTRISGPGAVAGAEQRPARPLDDADHGVEGVQRAPRFVDQAARVGDRRREQPDLEEERHDVADVSVADVECRKPHADAERRDQRQPERGARPRRVGAQGRSRTEHQPDEDDPGDREVDEAGMTAATG